MKILDNHCVFGDLLIFHYLKVKNSQKNSAVAPPRGKFICLRKKGAQSYSFLSRKNKNKKKMTAPLVFYLINLFNSSYPEGNFGGNQLLDGSISLSPLYPSMTNDLHVSIATSLHQSFP